MIAKITRGASVGGLAAYLHGPGRANEHVYDGTLGGAVIGGTLGAEGSRDGRGWAADMQAAIDARPEVTGPVWHMSLRCAPGDRTLSDAGWRHAAQTMGERMGWADRPWVMVRHGEDHVHVVVSRVGWDRSLWHARHDRRAAQEARQVVERELGLKRAPVRREGGRSLTSGEHSQGLRTGQTPAREVLRDRVQACAQAARGLGRETFEDLLVAQGVDFRANVASTGRVSGYSFALDGHTDAAGEQVWWKASQLDKGLSWKSLNATLAAPLPEVHVEIAPKRWTERKSAYQERVLNAQIEALNADLDSRRARSFRVANDARKAHEKDRALAWRVRQASSERTQIAAKRDVLGRRVKTGDQPLGGIPLSALKAHQLASIAQATHPREAVTRRPTPRIAGTGARPYIDRARSQAQAGTAKGGRSSLGR